MVEEPGGTQQGGKKKKPEKLLLRYVLRQFQTVGNLRRKYNESASAHKTGK